MLHSLLYLGLSVIPGTGAQRGTVDIIRTYTTDATIDPEQRALFSILRLATGD